MAAEAIADSLELELLSGPAAARPMSWVREGALAARNTRQTDLDLAVSTMSRRAKLLDERYPILVTDGGLKRRTSQHRSPYEAMLLVTTGSPWLTFPRDRLSSAAELFEHIVTAASQSLLGGGAHALRFGHPGEPGRPPEFPQAIPWLVKRMNLKGGTAYRDPARKDGGVDVVAWRPFPDGRAGFPIHLVQVTLEKNFAYKAGDINSRLWSLLLGLDVDPTLVLAVPRTLPEDKRWAEVATRAILLERIRIAGLLPASLPMLSEPSWSALLESLLNTYAHQFEEQRG